jgi:hypothetical protein
MQHPNQNACNIRLETDDNMPLKQLQQIQHVQHPPIYLCNIHMKLLQHASETFETIEMYICNTGEAWAGRFRLTGREPTASGCAQAPPSTSTSGTRENHHHQR